MPLSSLHRFPSPTTNPLYHSFISSLSSPTTPPPHVPSSPHSPDPFPGLHSQCTTPLSTVAIPLEIVLSILQFACYSNDTIRPDISLLQTSSLVCRAWSLQAQKLLFSHVTLETVTAFRSFYRAVARDTARGRILGDAVLHMRITLDHNQPSSLDHHSFALAVAICPNLYDLDISLYGSAATNKPVTAVQDPSQLRRPAPSFDNFTLSTMRNGPSITALQFSNWSDNWNLFTQLLDIWPEINSIRITGISPEFIPVSTSPALPCSLHEVRMNFQIPPSQEFMDWLLHNSHDSLCVIGFEREPPLSILQHLASAHSSRLKSLSLPTCTSTDQTLVIQNCKNLQEVIIEAPPPVVFKILPQGLHHLALGVDKNTSISLLVEYIKSRGLELKAVTALTVNGGDRHPSLPTLKIACAIRGINLTFTTDVQMFRKMMRGNSVKSAALPCFRSCALNNF